MSRRGRVRGSVRGTWEGFSFGEGERERRGVAYVRVGGTVRTSGDDLSGNESGDGEDGDDKRRDHVDSI